MFTITCTTYCDRERATIQANDLPSCTYAPIPSCHTRLNSRLHTRVCAHVAAFSSLTCMYNTTGHDREPNIQLFNMVAVNVNGIQKIAIIRSATARLMSRSRRSVRDLLPIANTTITTRLPTMDSMVVQPYSTIRAILVSGDMVSMKAV